MRTVVAAMLRLFPARFRSELGADLLATFEDRWREQRSAAAGLRVAADLLRSALLLHATEFQRPSDLRRRKGDHVIKALWQDIRFAVRTLAKAPGFTAVALATLALGIGANTAIYSVVNAVLLKGLPYPDAGRLVFVNESLPRGGNLNVAWLDFVDWRAQNRVFSSMAVIQPNTLNYTGGEAPKSVEVGWASSALFAMLGAKPMAGRMLGEADDRAGAAAAAVVSFRFWRDELKGDPHAVGKDIGFEFGSAVLAGVLTPDFKFPGPEIDVYVPIGLRAGEKRFANRGDHPGLWVYAKLLPGVTLERARSDMKTIMDRLSQAYPESNRNESAVVTALTERLVGNVRTELLMLLGAVAFVLLIACANVAHLALARATGRQREFAIRAAIGAGRGRLVRQLFVESSLLSLAGGAAGLGLA